MLFHPNIYYTFLFSSLIITLNFFIFKKISKINHQEILIPKLIFYYHLIFSIFFLLNDIFSIFRISPGSDGLSFYYNSSQMILFENITFSPGHNFLYYISYFLNKIYFDFISSNFIFGILGSLSILLFYISISKLLKNNFDKNIIILFILLPSYNFWSSGISKDVITLFSLSLLLYSFIKNNFKYLIISVIILFSVRVHLGLLIIISLILTISICFLYALFFKSKLYFFKRELKKKYSASIFAISLIFSLMIIKIYFFESTINIKSTIIHFQNMYPGENFIETNFFLFRLFEYLFRPYLWENTNIVMKFLSLENVFILLLLCLLIINLSSHKIKKIDIGTLDIKIFILLGFILIAIFQVVLTSNTGIALRQKWTFLPGLFFTLMYLKSNLLFKKNN